jgi:hypothetical protein
MALHYIFDEPLDVSNMVRDLAKSIESRPTDFRYGPQDPVQAEFDVAVRALREAADKIEAAVHGASNKT